MSLAASAGGIGVRLGMAQMALVVGMSLRRAARLASQQASV